MTDSNLAFHYRTNLNPLNYIFIQNTNYSNVFSEPNLNIHKLNIRSEIDINSKNGFREVNYEINKKELFHSVKWCKTTSQKTPLLLYTFGIICMIGGLVCLLGGGGYAIYSSLNPKFTSTQKFKFTNESFPFIVGGLLTTIIGVYCFLVSIMHD